MILFNSLFPSIGSYLQELDFGLYFDLCFGMTP
jgi:hypothetical protein